MTTKPDATRIAIFVAIAFAIAWTGGLAVFLTGGFAHSPILIPGTGVTLAIVLLATVYMWAPAAAHLMTRLITREGWRDLYLRPRWVDSWLYLCAAWFVPTLLTLAGAAVFFLIFPDRYDPTLRSAQALLRQMAMTSGRAIPMTAQEFIGVQLASAAFLAPLINAIATFGEEFGWRAYLLPKLMAFGYRKAVILMGVTWGVWHWPIIAMGHNYGLHYPGYPLTGMLAMVWFTIQVGILLGWITLRSGTVWPAVFGHAAINGVAGAPILLYYGSAVPLLGPAMTGIVAAIPMTILSMWLLWRPGGGLLDAVSEEAPCNP